MHPCIKVAHVLMQMDDSFKECICMHRASHTLIKSSTKTRELNGGSLWRIHSAEYPMYLLALQLGTCYTHCLGCAISNVYLFHVFPAETLLCLGTADLPIVGCKFWLP